MTDPDDDAPLLLKITAPFASFRPDASREYQDTHPVPPPSAVYGMLLSLCGVRREEKNVHRGVRLAVALEGEPGRSRVFRKLRRGKELENLRPDYQDLLCDLTVWVHLDRGADAADRPLTARVRDALRRPGDVLRSGGVSLGESSFLIDAVTDRAAPPDRLTLVRPDPRGFHLLPIWVDHADRANTVRDRFTIEEGDAADLPACAVTVGGAP